MPRIRDMPIAVKREGAWRFLKSIYARVTEDNLFTWAAAMAYAWLFAVFPFFLILMTLLPYLPEQWKGGAKHQIAVVVYQLPKEAADTIWINIDPRIDKLLYQSRGALLSIGLVLTLWAASGGMAVTMGALDKCYDVQRPRPYYIQRPLAVVLTVVVAILILLVLILLPVGTIATNYITALLKKQGLEKYLPLIYVWQVLRYLLAVILMFAILDTLYYFGTNVRRRWRAITPGALFSVIVWIMLGVVFRLYTDRFGKYNETYGTVGGAAVLLLVFYIDAVVLLIGAEINSHIDRILAGKKQRLP